MILRKKHLQLEQFQKQEIEEFWNEEARECVSKERI
jgi:hypothetical protein